MTEEAHVGLLSHGGESGAGQNIAMHASPTARNLAFLISALSVMHDDTTDRTCVTEVRCIVFSVGEV